MKNIVINDEYNQIDLKPSDLVKKYISLTGEDVSRYWSLPGSLHQCRCPACASDSPRDAFVKMSFSYKQCGHCLSLYVSPRPDDRSLNEYYQKSRAREYWRDELSRATDKKRKEKIIKPRFQWILESTREHFSGAKTWVDINTSQPSYIDAMNDADLFGRKIILNPYLRLDPSDFKRIHVMTRPWWEHDLKGQADVVSLFEVVDHTSDVPALLATVQTMLKNGGLCFLTAILSSGFDIQTLWDRAENIYPPDRLNCLSVKGFEMLFEKHGFECLEMSTPGILDVEIVAKALSEDPAVVLPRFERQIIDSRDDGIKKSFQQFLQSACLSSYGRILIRKKG